MYDLYDRAAPRETVQIGSSWGVLTLEIIETAVKEEIPFVIKMADWEKYEVRGRSQIAWRKANVVVMDDKDSPHVLPLLTMTCLSYLPAESGSDK